MPTFNKQDIFNKAYRGLKAQGFVKSVGNKGCMYRGFNSLKCAIGHCISDSEYTLELEGRSANTHKIGAILGYVPYSDEAWFAIDLQGIHDNSRGPEYMKDGLHAFAKKHGLTVPQD